MSNLSSSSPPTSSEVQAQINYRLLEQSAGSERRYRALVESLRDPVLQLDGNLSVSFVNRAWTEVLGYDGFESVGRSLLDFVHPDDRVALEGALAGLRDRGTASGETRIVCADRTTVQVRYSVQRILENDFVGALHDITDQKTLEESLRKAKRDAEDANRMKSSFLANMSHEIRTPLSAVLGFADLLGHGELDEGEREDYAALVARNGAHLLALVDDILDFSKIESGKLEVTQEPFELCGLIDDVMRQSEPAASMKNLALSTLWNGDRPTGALFVSDRTRLRQILTNLISNAIKFTAEGSVTLEVRASNPDEVLSFIVSDTGIGITQEQLPTVFDPFRQADQAITRRYGGTGLGLAISQRLAIHLGGSLTATSESGRGSQFRLELPLHTVDATRWSDVGDREPSEREAPSAPYERPAGECRVLVVEDTLDLQKLMSRFLRDMGLEVDTASHGEEAIARIHELAADKRSYKAVLMDMQMPVLDGYSATRRLRADGYDGLIVAMTAYAMRGDREKCLDAGCDDYLPKPVTRESLRALFDRHCGAG